jgi:CBS domain-containing protein
MQCKDIMKKQITFVVARDSVETAARKMREENVGFLPVCDNAKLVIGAITDRDLALRVVAVSRAGDTPVDVVMTREVVACRPEDDVRRAEKLMGDNQKSRIVCTDEQGRLLGVISLSDIAQHENEQQRIADTMRRVTTREARP